MNALAALGDWLTDVRHRLVCLRKGHDWRQFGDGKGGLRLCRRCPAVESTNPR